jgi:hypothetical protein
MLPKQDRRVNQRTKIERLTYIELPSGDGGIAKDVSEGGLGFYAVSPPETPASFPISIRLWSSGSFKLVAALVELAWTDATRKSGGLRFTYLPDESREQLRKWHFESNARPAAEEQPHLAHPVRAYGFPPRIGKLAFSNAVQKCALRQPVAPITRGVVSERNLSLLTVTGVSILAGVIGFMYNTGYRDIREGLDSKARIQGERTYQLHARELASNGIPMVALVRGFAAKNVLPVGAPAQAGTEDEFLFVQVGPFYSKQGEESLVERLRRNNFAAYASQLGNSELYRVQLGPYTTDEAADTAQDDLQKGGFDSFVRESPRSKPGL